MIKYINILSPGTQTGYAHMQLWHFFEFLLCVLANIFFTALAVPHVCIFCLYWSFPATPGFLAGTHAYQTIPTTPSYFPGVSTAFLASWAVAVSYVPFFLFLGLLHVHLGLRVCLFLLLLFIVVPAASDVCLQPLLASFANSYWQFY